MDPIVHPQPPKLDINSTIPSPPLSLVLEPISNMYKMEDISPSKCKRTTKAYEATSGLANHANLDMVDSLLPNRPTLWLTAALSRSHHM
jgi:hypothetical protein